MNQEFIFPKGALAVAAVMALILASSASINTEGTRLSNGIVPGAQWSGAVSPDSTGRELSSTKRSDSIWTSPEGMRAIILAAAADAEEDEESGSGDEAEKDEGSEGRDRLGDAPKLG